MRYKRLLALGVAMVTLMSSSICVSAMDLKDIFDAEYYASQYPDLKEAFGNDADALFEHYVTFGLAEGRNGSRILDVADYRRCYPDLKEAFGTDWEAYVDHFYSNGIYEEHRRYGVLFDPIAYADAYKDVRWTFGEDWEAITKHYLTNGIKEKRTEGTAAGFESIAQREEVEEWEQLLLNEEWRALMAKRPGVPKEVMEKARDSYEDAVEAFIDYTIASSVNRKNKYIKQYNEALADYLACKAEIKSHGVISQYVELYELTAEEHEKLLKILPDASSRPFEDYIDEIK